MNVLVVCLRYPFPLTDGEALRIFNYVRELEGRHAFDLVCLGKGDAPEPVKVMFRRIETIRVAGQRASSAPLRRIVDAFSVDSFLPTFPEVTVHLRRILAERKYDLIWTATDFVHCIPPECGVPVLADIVDDMVLQYRRELSWAESAKDFLSCAKRVMLARAYEKRYFAPAAACLFAADEDANCFRSLAPNARVEVIPNGVDSAYFAPGGEESAEPVVIFEGSMSFPPNADAAVYLCKEILPHIVAGCREVRVVLVGRDPPAHVQALASERVTVTGFVDDVRPFLARASVFLCPLRIGAGIKNKILQAWSMAKAVVATPVSVGGLRYVDGENLLVRDTPQELAEAVVALLGETERRRMLGQKARTIVVEHYTWQARASQLEELMRSLCKETDRAVA